MEYYARWGPKGFTISSWRLALLEGFTTSLTLKEDSENDTSGTQPTNTRGRELRPITFSVTYLRAAGMDPRDQIDQWEKELGNAYPMIIGGQRFGPEKMKLTGVESSDFLFGPNGEILQVRVSITLEEYSDGKTSKLVSNNTSTAASKKQNFVDKKNEALKAAPTAADKAAVIAGRGIEVN